MSGKKQATAVFSGYSARKIAALYPSCDPDYVMAVLGRLLDRLLKGFYNAGYRRFLCAMHEGFELLAAERVLEFREKEGYGDIELVAVLAAREETAAGLSSAQLIRQNILNKTDCIITFFSENEDELNDYLFEQADMLCCFQADTVFEGEAGETRRLFERFRKAGRTVNDIVPI